MIEIKILKRLNQGIVFENEARLCFFCPASSTLSELAYFWVQFIEKLKYPTMKKWMFLLVCTCSLFLTGCINILEEVFLNRDGSGKYTITMDMSEMMSNPMMKGALQGAAEEAPEGTIPEKLEKDTVMRYTDMAKPGQLTAADARLLKDVVMKMKMSESKNEMFITIDMPFKHIDELAKIGEAMQKIQPEEGDEAAGPLGGMGAIGGMASSEKQFELNKKTLVRLPVAAQAQMMKEMFGEEQMEMAKMLFGSATYKTVYHLPGKVKKAKIAGAVVDGNTVTVSNGFIDILEGKAKFDGEIKFK